MKEELKVFFNNEFEIKVLDKNFYSYLFAKIVDLKQKQKESKNVDEKS